jgi:hypothetical protein
VQGHKKTDTITRAQSASQELLMMIMAAGGEFRGRTDDYHDQRKEKNQRKSSGIKKIII